MESVIDTDDYKPFFIEGKPSKTESNRLDPVMPFVVSDVFSKIHISGDVIPAIKSVRNLGRELLPGRPFAAKTRFSDTRDIDRKDRCFPSTVLDLLDYFFCLSDPTTKRQPSLPESLTEGNNRVLASELFEHIGHYWFRLNSPPHPAFKWTIDATQSMVLSEFPSCIERIVREHLGKNLAEKMMMNVIINKRRFTILTHRERDATARQLESAVIQRINQKINERVGSTILFLGSVAREEWEERMVFMDKTMLLHRTPFLYGLEEQSAFTLTNVVSSTDNIRNGKPILASVKGLLTAAAIVPLFQTVWRAVCQKNPSPVPKIMMDYLQDIVIGAQTHAEAALKTLEEGPYVHLVTEWMHLFESFILALTEHYSFPEHIKDLVKIHLANPNDKEVYKAFLQEIVGLRSKRSAQMLLKMVSKLPDYSEVVIIANHLFLPGLVNGILNENKMD